MDLSDFGGKNEREGEGRCERAGHTHKGASAEEERERGRDSGCLRFRPSLSLLGSIEVMSAQVSLILIPSCHCHTQPTHGTIICCWAPPSIPSSANIICAWLQTMNLEFLLYCGGSVATIIPPCLPGKCVGLGPGGLAIGHQIMIEMIFVNMGYHSGWIPSR